MPRPGKRTLKSSDAVDDLPPRSRLGIVSALRKMLRPVYRPAKLLARFAAWAIPSMIPLGKREPVNERRVLVIYDTSTQPFSVGDLPICQEASLILCEKHGVSLVDPAIVYDPSDPASSDPVFSASVNEENLFFHLASLLPIAQVNPRLASVLAPQAQRGHPRHAPAAPVSGCLP